MTDSQNRYEQFLDDFNNFLRFEYSIRALGLCDKNKNLNIVLDIIKEFHPPQHKKEKITWDEVMENQSLSIISNSREIFSKVLTGTIRESELYTFSDIHPLVKTKLDSAKSQTRHIKKSQSGSDFLKSLEFYLKDYPAFTLLRKNNIRDIYNSVCKWATKSSYDENSIKTNFFSPRPLPKACAIYNFAISTRGNGHLSLTITDPKFLDEKSFEATISEFSRQFYETQHKHLDIKKLSKKSSHLITKRNQIKSKLEGLYCWDIIYSDAAPYTNVEAMKHAIDALGMLGDRNEQVDYENKYKSLRKFIDSVDKEIRKTAC
tara:strand:- start:1622 stop:2575 length:954 start_codon:yes stop_codon:yes gene_type:complete